MYKYILFDLDGTLTDSAPGIIRCVQYALEKCGKGTCPDRELLPFIGPPLTSCCPLPGRWPPRSPPTPVP